MLLGRGSILNAPYDGLPCYDVSLKGQAVLHIPQRPLCGHAGDPIQKKRCLHLLIRYVFIIFACIKHLCVFLSDSLDVISYFS